MVIFMFVHTLDPVLLSLGPLEIRWYGFIYAFGFVIAYFFLQAARKQTKLLSSDHIDSLMVYLIVGVVTGARVFEILFYQPLYFLNNPLEIFALWHGGLSFHGGLVGAAIAVWLFCRRYHVRFLALADVLVIPLALALGFGRIANFINGELYGRLTDVYWGVKFPGADGYRHPSQLYEAAKNFFVFGVLLLLRKRGHHQGYLFGWFMVMYGLLRFFIEYVREPETMVWVFTMGQALSLPMIVVGWWLMRKKT
jgi:phosphatidylglycerol---prolipoprotein diacylglyceryl transferase